MQKNKTKEYFYINHFAVSSVSEWIQVVLVLSLLRSHITDKIWIWTINDLKGKYFFLINNCQACPTRMSFISDDCQAQVPNPPRPGGDPQKSSDNKDGTEWSTLLVRQKKFQVDSERKDMD